MGVVTHHARLCHYSRCVCYVRDIEKAVEMTFVLKQHNGPFSAAQSNKSWRDNSAKHIAFSCNFSTFLKNICHDTKIKLTREVYGEYWSYLSVLSVAPGFVNRQPNYAVLKRTCLSGVLDPTYVVTYVWFKRNCWHFVTMLP